jgi:hypothetical protein
MTRMVWNPAFSLHDVIIFTVNIALTWSRGNKSLVARKLKISRKRLCRIIDSDDRLAHWRPKDLQKCGPTYLDVKSSEPEVKL